MIHNQLNCFKAMSPLLESYISQCTDLRDVIDIIWAINIDTHPFSWKDYQSADPAQLEDFMDCIKAYGEKESYTAEEAYEILLLFLKQYHDRAPSAEIKDLMDDLLENGHPNGIRFLAYKKYLERGSQ